MYVYLCVYPYACRMLQQNIQAPPLSDGASTIARLGQAIGLLGDPAALQARIDAYRSARRNSTTTNSHTTHTVHRLQARSSRAKHAYFLTVISGH